jgi:hypothetical protein
MPLPRFPSLVESLPGLTYLGVTRPMVEQNARSALQIADR